MHRRDEYVPWGHRAESGRRRLSGSVCIIPVRTKWPPSRFLPITAPFGLFWGIKSQSCSKYIAYITASPAFLDFTKQKGSRSNHPLFQGAQTNRSTWQLRLMSPLRTRLPPITHHPPATFKRPHGSRTAPSWNARLKTFSLHKIGWSCHCQKENCALRGLQGPGGIWRLQLSSPTTRRR